MKMASEDREKVSSPLNFKWSEDPFVDVKALEQDTFTDGNESLDSDVCVDLRSDILDPTVALPPYQNFGLESKEDVDPKEQSLKQRNFSGTNFSSFRKRSLPSTQGNQSDSGPVSRRKKKPKGMPKRPLSAYNLYFQSKRADVLAEAENRGEKIGFEGLGKIIGKKWRELDASERKTYEKLAEKDSVRYRKEMDLYNEMKAEKKDDQRNKSSSSYWNTELASSLKRNPDDDQITPLRPHLKTPSFQEQQRRLQALNREDPFTAVPAGQIKSSSSVEEFSRAPSTSAKSQFPHTSGTQVYSNFVPAESPRRSYQPQYIKDADVQHSQFPPSNPQPGRKYTISVPPPPVGVEPVTPPNSFAIPPGMEIHLNERKYRVHYKCYSMPRDAAEKYVESLTGASPSTNSRTSGAKAPYWDRLWNNSY